MNYKLGVLKRFEGIKEGIENTNYYIETEKGKYILTINEKRVKVSDLPFFSNLMVELSKNGFICPKPILNKDNNYISDINNKKFMHNIVQNVSAILLFAKRKKNLSVILNYDESSNKLFEWYQQLVSESLGKKSKGIIPLITTMPKDNHSLMQYFLDGPKNNFYTFYSVKDKKSQNIKTNLLLNSFSFIKNKNLSQIKEAQRMATENIFSKKKIPFRTIEIVNKNEQSIGEIFTFFMLETILLGRALKVNPFDQPSVELIKKETKKIIIRG